jgi:hypothetical protein
LWESDCCQARTNAVSLVRCGKHKEEFGESRVGGWTASEVGLVWTSGPPRFSRFRPRSVLSPRPLVPECFAAAMSRKGDDGSCGLLGRVSKTDRGH